LFAIHGVKTTVKQTKYTHSSFVRQTSFRSHQHRYRRMMPEYSGLWRDIWTHGYHCTLHSHKERNTLTIGV